MQFKTCTHSSGETFRRFTMLIFLPSQSHVREKKLMYINLLSPCIFENKNKEKTFLYCALKKFTECAFLSLFTFSLMKRPNIHTLSGALTKINVLEKLFHPFNVFNCSVVLFFFGSLFMVILKQTSVRMSSLVTR